MNDTPPAQSPLPVADTPANHQTWWSGLEPQWQAAFQAAFLGHTNPPADEELENLRQTPALRLAGPTAPFPNMRFALTNCSGLTGMSRLETLVLTNHAIESIWELAHLTKLKSLFVSDNAIRSLAGIDGITQLEQLYAQANQIDSLEPIRNLTHLREVYVSGNALTSLKGLTRQHAQTIKAFFCLPNEHLADREIIRVERTLGIRCRSL
ncbi:hypothetical protein GCM10023189_18960 [Nibrella saemangeumensis]|uniref:Leucine-rich repeat domain-containing protein n=1 Tax=Nibrella saemangeumensis TaxID=1084526 RepID=A0ABP8MNN3_9BACT